MASREGKYNIKAISQLVGVQPGTLRAWERRYNIVDPVRNDSGHRLYTDRDLKTIKWLTDKVNSGFTISQAVSLLEKEAVFSIEEEDTATTTSKIKEDLLRALLSFQETRAQQLMDQAFSLYSIEKVVIDILGSLLISIGDLWEKGKITSAHEHYASQLIKTRIGIILYSFPSPPIMPRAIAVCGPNERHEVGLLIFTLFLKMKGFEVIYLGSSVDNQDVKIVVGEVQPFLLFMSCTMKENQEETIALVKEVNREFPSLSIGLGGAAFSSVEDESILSFIVGDSKQEWERWINIKLTEIQMQ
ncbi:MerR family transcriptional regulator [Priestia filamentosa]|uniref:MerR family transcriptional regulator n=1 Tax=Priestia filamentosa TaxID=1402861 RepID=UPI001FB37410|nr:MerR family transcriptional regulator [Priestia filamentosa]MED3725161.1 MerR family transcriptional regulator [Priestia filamentosa]UOE61580.1 MerR family transcriptional regulator [Priestia filamentosa]